MITILVKAYNKETCNTVERLYKVESLSEYLMYVKPAYIQAWKAAGQDLELIAEYIKVEF